MGTIIKWPKSSRILLFIWILMSTIFVSFSLVTTEELPEIEIVDLISWENWEVESGTKVDMASEKFIGKWNLIYTGSNISEYAEWVVTCMAPYPTQWNSTLRFNSTSSRGPRERERWQLDPFPPDKSSPWLPNAIFKSEMSVTFSLGQSGSLICQSLVDPSLSSTINIFIKGKEDFRRTFKDQLKLIEPIPCLVNDIAAQPFLLVEFLSDDKDVATMNVMVNETDVDYDPTIGFMFRELPDYINNTLRFKCNGSIPTFRPLIEEKENKVVIVFNQTTDRTSTKVCEADSDMEYVGVVVGNCASREDCDLLADDTLERDYKEQQWSGVAKCLEEDGVLSAKDYFFTGLDGDLYLASDSIKPAALMSFDPLDEKQLYRNRKINFTCHSSSFLLWPNIKFAVKFRDESGPKLYDEITPEDADGLECDGRTKRCSKWKVIQLQENMTEIHCLSPWANSTDWNSATLLIKVEAGVKPQIYSEKKKHGLYELKDSPQLECYSTGDPAPNITWEFPDPEVYKYVKDDGLGVSIINFTTSTMDEDMIRKLTGKYICNASNEFGYATHEFDVYAEETGLNIWGKFGIGGAAVVVAVLVITTAALWMKYRAQQRKIRRLTEKEISEFRDGVPIDPGTEEGGGAEKANSKPFEMIVDKDDLVIDYRRVLGEGEFGRVCCGFHNGVQIAVKTVKNTEVEQVKIFLTELKIVAFIGSHPHIVEFLGAEISDLKNNNVYGCFELSPFGNLRDYLMDNRTHFMSHIHNFPGSSTQVNTPTGNLIHWCTQIADGMTRLEELKIVHGDLALRNILVFPNNIVKINDFGLSRKLYNYAIVYKKNINSKNKKMVLPAAWMSFESLNCFEFSTKSDVWSFAVTAWELFSMGQIPFPNYSWQNIIQFWGSGQTLNHPCFASLRIYKVLLTCWALEPSLRPSFRQLKQFFDVDPHTLIDQNLRQQHGKEDGVQPMEAELPSSYTQMSSVFN